MSAPDNRLTLARSFAKYSELPAELRLKIIEEIVDSAPLAASKRSFGFPLGMSSYASIDREWNNAVEIRNFRQICLRSTEIDEFGAICGKRSGRLSKVCLDIVELDDFRWSHEPVITVYPRCFPS